MMAPTCAENNVIKDDAPDWCLAVWCFVDGNNC